MSFVQADKPAGIPLEDVDGLTSGLIGHRSQVTGQYLLACHSLDTEVSGAVVLATSGEARRDFGARCAGGEVRFVFRMVTDRVGPGSLELTPADHPTTVFRRMPDPGGPSADKPPSLWEVEARESRAEPVRRRAAELGIPILGDPLHGGSPFPRLMLHCTEIGLGCQRPSHCFSSTQPLLFARLTDLANADLATWLTALDRRQRLFDLGDESTVRLIHTDGNGVRCDRFGPLCWFYWYRRHAPGDGDLATVEALAAAAGAAHWRVHHMTDRGGDPQTQHLWSSGGPAEWTGCEHGLRYLFRERQGLSPGLFLDQRQNRRWVQAHAAGRRVLNLFAYTGGFGLAAAHGGAAQVTNVDTSRRTLDWARDNFALNGLDATPETSRVEFQAIDARLFLKGCRRRGRTFDLVVCDPPSFARSREGVWRVDRDLPELVRAAADTLAPGASLVVSTNYEQWTQQQLDSVVSRALSSFDRCRCADLPPADWDFEAPGDPPVLKAVRFEMG